MHRVTHLGWPRLRLTAAALLLAAGSQAQTNGSYDLPLAEASEWRVFVFGARFPGALADKPVPFTVDAKWQANDGPGNQRLTGKTNRFKTTELSLSVPAGCSSLVLSLDWEVPGVDLDIGLSCESLGMRLAPVFTVLKPERVRLDAQTAPFYKWLASSHPDWWKGYPFWAEIEPAPKHDPAKGAQ
jgi:hypothetical protein